MVQELTTPRLQIKHRYGFFLHNDSKPTFCDCKTEFSYKTKES